MRHLVGVFSCNAMVTVLTQKALVLWFTGAEGLSTPTHCPTPGRERLQKCFKAVGNDVTGFIFPSYPGLLPKEGSGSVWHIRMSL